MPELPEVETIRRRLEPVLTGRDVTACRVAHRPIVAGPNDPPAGYYRQRNRPDPATLRRVPARLLLAGATIDRLERRGKQLAIIATDGRAITVQLGMTGRLAAIPPGARLPDPAHTHITWQLNGQGGRLAFSDPRRFGLVRALPDFQTNPPWTALGPDALSITARDLASAVAGSAAPIKARLLDQAALAGVGNIYADESLHRARIAPHRVCTTLSADEWRALAAAIRHTLRRAIEAGGSSIRDYLDSDGRPGSFQARHAVYGRAGQPCRHCRTPLEAGRLAQRATVHCPACQS